MFSVYYMEFLILHLAISAMHIYIHILFRVTKPFRIPFVNVSYHYLRAGKPCRQLAWEFEVLRDHIPNGRKHGNLGPQSQATSDLIFFPSQCLLLLLLLLSFFLSLSLPLSLLLLPLPPCLALFERCSVFVVHACRVPLALCIAFRGWVGGQFQE